MALMIKISELSKLSIFMPHRIIHLAEKTILFIVFSGAQEKPLPIYPKSLWEPVC